MKTCGHLVWLVTAVALGCALDPKTVGQGTDSEDGSGDASAGSGDSSDGSSAGVSEGASSDDGDCTDANCVWDPCADLACGAPCEYCPPWDTDCAAPGTLTHCSPEGTCEPPGEIEGPCEDQGLQPGFEDGMSERGGCRDMTVWAHDPVAGVALHLDVEGLVAMAEDAGETIVVEYAANDPALALEVTLGTDLTAWTCTDAVIVDPVITDRWVPSDEQPDGSNDPGTVGIAVTPGDEDGIGAVATVTFTGVPWLPAEAPQGEPAVPVVLELLVLEGVSVGWLPG